MFSESRGIFIEVNQLFIWNKYLAALSFYLVEMKGLFQLIYRTIKKISDVDC